MRCALLSRLCIFCRGPIACRSRPVPCTGSTRWRVWSDGLRVARRRGRSRV